MGRDRNVPLSLRIVPIDLSVAERPLTALKNTLYSYSDPACGSSGDSNLRTHAWDPPIETNITVSVNLTGYEMEIARNDR